MGNKIFIKLVNEPITEQEQEVIDELKEEFRRRIPGLYVNPKTLEYTDACYALVNVTLANHGFKPRLRSYIEGFLDRNFILRR